MNRRRLFLTLAICLVYGGCDLATLLEPEGVAALTGVDSQSAKYRHGTPMRIAFESEGLGKNYGEALWDLYPDALARIGQPRQVQFLIRIGPTGDIETTQITESGGDAEVDLAATRLVAGWRYESPRLYGRPDGMWLERQVGWPLVVVDCEERPDMPLSDVRALDIKHVEIIKGRASGWIWGAWASAGVIEIFTTSYSGPVQRHCGRNARTDGA